MKQLFLCNSVYQVMVVLWMKHLYYREIDSDLIISDHMNGGEKIAERIQETEMFTNVTYAKTLKEARYKVKREGLKNICAKICPHSALKEYYTVSEEYTDVFVANFDGFTQLLYTALCRKNKNLKVHIFEDGLSTYCEIEKYYNYFEYYYYDPSEDGVLWKRILHQHIYRLRPLYGNVNDIWVFNPELMKWNPNCSVYKIKKINQLDEEFKRLINFVFDYKKSVDCYDRKYIFFEESFFADGEEINDVELVQQLAEKVGKENIIVKIHPRNPVNRFVNLGYMTNINTSIPWEVVLMNMDDVTEKIFLTVASSAILNPIMIFGIRIKAYSLYYCLNIVPNRLQGESWEFLKELFFKYSDMISLCNNLNDVN